MARPPTLTESGARRTLRLLAEPPGPGGLAPGRRFCDRRAGFGRNSWRRGCRSRPLRENSVPLRRDRAGRREDWARRRKKARLLAEGSVRGIVGCAPSRERRSPEALIRSSRSEERVGHCERSCPRSLGNAPLREECIREPENRVGQRGGPVRRAEDCRPPAEERSSVTCRTSGRPEGRSAPREGRPSRRNDRPRCPQRPSRPAEDLSVAANATNSVAEDYPPREVRRGHRARGRRHRAEDWLSPRRQCGVRTRRTDDHGVGASSSLGFDRTARERSPTTRWLATTWAGGACRSQTRPTAARARST